MTDPTAAAPQPGWYPDPGGSPSRRWWNGTAWTEYLDATPPAGPPVQTALPEGTRVDTPFIWLLVLLPLVSTVVMLFVDYEGYFRESVANAGRLGVQPPLNAGLVVAQLVGWLLFIATVLLAYFDWRALGRLGIVRPFHWAWGFLSPVYVIGRAVVLRRRVGRGLAPLWVWIAVVALGTIVSTVKIAGALSAAFSSLPTLPGA